MCACVSVYLVCVRVSVYILCACVCQSYILCVRVFIVFVCCGCLGLKSHMPQLDACHDRDDVICVELEPKGELEVDFQARVRTHVEVMCMCSCVSVCTSCACISCSSSLSDANCRRYFALVYIIPLAFTIYVCTDLGSSSVVRNR